MYQSVPASMYPSVPARRHVTVGASEYVGARAAAARAYPLRHFGAAAARAYPLRRLRSLLRVRALMHAHGVLYRDLKPENLMLDAREHVRLVDYRLALIGTDWFL